jgi:hypothetical protein
MFLEYRMRTFEGAFHMNPDYMHWYGWTPMKETPRKSKTRLKSSGQRRPLPLHISHRGIRVRRGFGLTLEPLTEVAQHYGISSFA